MPDQPIQGPAHSSPSAVLLALEGRALAEWAAGLITLPFLPASPRGDGHPVLVLPGLLAGDASTLVLRRYLNRAGFASHPWRLGRNRGPSGELIERLAERVHRLSARSGRKVSLVGWSMGGALAHGLAQAIPERVRSVITLGSPLAGHPHQTNAWRLFERVSGQRADAPELLARMGQPARVPTTAILSKSDGIVHWRCSLVPVGEQAESIEVNASHFGLGAHPAVLWIIAERLAQPEGLWRPFRREGTWRRLFYRDPRRLRIDGLASRGPERPPPE